MTTLSHKIFRDPPYKMFIRASDVAQQVKALAVKADSHLKTHIVEEENPLKLFSELHLCVYEHPGTHTHTHIHR